MTFSHTRTKNIKISLYTKNDLSYDNYLNHFLILSQIEGNLYYKFSVTRTINLNNIYCFKNEIMLIQHFNFSDLIKIRLTLSI